MTELLIVIAILLLLTGMLLPALNKARQTALKVNCLGNLGQVGRGTVFYSIDNQDFLLPVSGNYRGMGGTSKMHWSYYIRYYIGIAVDNPDVSSSSYPENVPEKYRRGIMRCPAGMSGVSSFGRICYGMFRYYIGGVDPNTLQDYGRGKKIRDIVSVTGKAYLIDSVFPQAPDGSEITSGLPTWSRKDFISSHLGIYAVENNGGHASRLRHGNSSNVFFLDGHAENFTAKELAARQESQWYNSVMFGSKGFK